jgi:hypothetical protein
MGAYTCEFGVVHKVCRCREPHKIVCDVPEQHGGKEDKLTYALQAIGPDEFPESYYRALAIRILESEWQL